jgi:hypothetical protein
MENKSYELKFMQLCELFDVSDFEIPAFIAILAKPVGMLIKKTAVQLELKL